MSAIEPATAPWWKIVKPQSTISLKRFSVRSAYARAFSGEACGAQAMKVVSSGSDAFVASHKPSACSPTVASKVSLGVNKVRVSIERCYGQKERGPVSRPSFWSDYLRGLRLVAAHIAGNRFDCAHGPGHCEERKWLDTVE